MEKETNSTTLEEIIETEGPNAGKVDTQSDIESMMSESMDDAVESGEECPDRGSVEADDQPLRSS